MYWNNQFSTFSLQNETLTDSYDDNLSVEDTLGYKLVTVYIEYTPQDAAGILYVQFESGPDESKFYPKSALLDASTGISDIKNHIFSIESNGAGTPVKNRLMIDMADAKLRISAKETASSHGTVSIILCRNEQFTK